MLIGLISWASKRFLWEIKFQYNKVKKTCRQLIFIYNKENLIDMMILTFFVSFYFINAFIFRSRLRILKNWGYAAKKEQNRKPRTIME